MSKALSFRKSSSRAAKFAAVAALSLALAATVSPAAQAASLGASGSKGLKHNVLTVSNGTRYVQIDGKTVDFRTVVRDLAWSPDGNKAVFVDGSSNLVVSDADGSNRVVVAKNPGGQNWNHPTWQTVPAVPEAESPARNSIVFVARTNGVSRLLTIPVTAVQGEPREVHPSAGPGEAPLPQTGNIWPNSGGRNGATVYANTGDGTVYIQDNYLRSQTGEVAKGSQPAVSPGGEDVVFVRSVKGHDHLFVKARGAKAPKDLTPNATTDYTQPTFSPDGRTIAARTPKGIVTLPVSGAAKPVVVTSRVGLPAYRG
ncbi:TolB family protein [Kitasatospora purpeofusca]|uniref:TolB family protein n=2 Tax=Kitasatospora purpeofusca TaxID=67352 RepID=UPI0037F68FED